MNGEEAKHEYDMLMWELNEMPATDDIKELAYMYESVKKRLEGLYKYYYARLTEIK